MHKSADDALVVPDRATGEPARRRAGDTEPVFVSQSPAIRDLRSRIDLVGRSEASVLITGESGSGKEVIARLIHQQGTRINRPFVAVNCAAMPKDVIDNELFGHEREAFTGASSKKAGCFELAHGGTLFLDEIAEMHPQSQAKLLRAIETKTFRRLGGKEEVHVDVRIVAATNRDVHQAMKSGELREDLYYRLSVIELHLPPLRERREDIPLLAAHFLRMFQVKYGTAEKTLTPKALEALRAYLWPGNVREFKNLMERTVLVCPDDTIDIHHLPVRVTKSHDPGMEIRIPIGTSLEAAARILITRTLAACSGNKSLAAKTLGISRQAKKRAPGPPQGGPGAVYFQQAPGAGATLMQDGHLPHVFELGSEEDVEVESVGQAVTRESHLMRPGRLEGVDENDHFLPENVIHRKADVGRTRQHVDDVRGGVERIRIVLGQMVILRQRGGRHRVDGDRDRVIGRSRCIGQGKSERCCRQDADFP
jgi:DNA-binding NtrC family response regulator